MTGGERFTLDVPADPAYVGTARMFASTLARQFEVGDEVVEDLKLAVSEACSRALAAADADHISVRAGRHDLRLVFEIEQGELPVEQAPTDTPTPSAQELAAGLSLELVSALFQDAEVTAGSAGPVLRFSVG